MRKKYKTPGEHLFAVKKPKTEEQKQRIRDGMRAYWAQARREYAQMKNQLPLQDA